MVSNACVVVLWQEHGDPRPPAEGESGNGHSRHAQCLLQGGAHCGRHWDGSDREPLYLLHTRSGKCTGTATEPCDVLWASEESTGHNLMQQKPFTLKIEAAGSSETSVQAAIWG